MTQLALSEALCCHGTFLGETSVEIPNGNSMCGRKGSVTGDRSVPTLQDRGENPTPAMR